MRLVASGRVFWCETDEGLEVTTDLARERGLRTLLKPHIWLRHAGDGAWRGDIAMETEEDWRRWFESYRRLALHYAALAERLGIPAYCRQARRAGDAAVVRGRGVGRRSHGDGPPAARLTLRT